MPGIGSILEDAIGTIHGTISTFLGTSPAPTPAGLRPITLADASKLITAGMTMAQLSALGYVIVG